TVSLYGAAAPYDGLAFAPDGTLWAANADDGQVSGTVASAVVKIAGTNTASPGAVLTTIPVPTTDMIIPAKPVDGVALELNPSNPNQVVAVFAKRNDGILTRVDVSTGTPTLVDVFTMGDDGNFLAVGPESCLYATQRDRVVRVTKADGSCSF